MPCWWPQVHPKRSIYCTSLDYRWEGSIFVIWHRICWWLSRNHSNLWRNLSYEAIWGEWGREGSYRGSDAVNKRIQLIRSSMDWHLGSAVCWCTPDHTKRSKDYVCSSNRDCLATIQFVVLPWGRSVRDGYSGGLERRILRSQMVMEAQTIQQVFGQIATICGFFAGDWTGLYMRCIPLYASLQRQV